jgi:hypothetical protein
MTMNQSSTLVGVFRDRASAEEAMHELNNAGFTHDQIRYAGPGSTGGFLEDIKSLFTGPGTSSEHLANDLTRMGLSNEEARYYANEYSNGHPIIAMKAPNHEQDALNILNRHGAYNYNMMAAQGKTPGYVPQSPGSPQQGQGYVQQSPDPTRQHPASRPQLDPTQQAAAARPPVDPTQQQPVSTPASGYTAPQGTAQANEQPSLQGVAATPGRDTELQRLQAQLQETRRQLQDARSKLQAAKDREAQLQTNRQRDTQLESMQQQLHDAQAQLQATLAELYRTQDRISQANP